MAQEDHKKSFQLTVNECHDLETASFSTRKSIVLSPEDKPRKLNTRFLKSFIYAVPALLAAAIWISMMVYFLAYYLTLPRNPATGARPHLGSGYSSWPFISSIGAVRETSFSWFCCTTASAFVTACLLDLYLAPQGHNVWLRRAKAFFGVICGIFLVALSFESDVPARGGRRINNHVILVSVQIYSACVVKTLGFICNWLLERKYATIRHAKVLVYSKRVKIVLFPPLTPPAVVCLSGIYACSGRIKGPGSVCYNYMALSAPLEWVLAVGWALWMLDFAFDIFQAQLVKDLIAAADAQEDVEKAETCDPSHP